MKTLNRKKKTDKVVGSNKPARSSGFNAVKMMRDIRNKISAETQEMSYEQLMKYISKKLKVEKSEIRMQK
jgi:hypothetical protein